MIQSDSWINFSASLHCAGFIKLAGRGLSGVERFIWDPAPATVSRVEIPEKFIILYYLVQGKLIWDRRGIGDRKEGRVMGFGDNGGDIGRMGEVG